MKNLMFEKCYREYYKRKYLDSIFSLVWKRDSKGILLL